MLHKTVLSDTTLYPKAQFWKKKAQSGDPKVQLWWQNWTRRLIPLPRRLSSGGKIGPEGSILLPEGSVLVAVASREQKAQFCDPKAQFVHNCSYQSGNEPTSAIMRPVVTRREPKAQFCEPKAQIVSRAEIPEGLLLQSTLGHGRYRRDAQCYMLK